LKCGFPDPFESVDASVDARAWEWNRRVLQITHQDAQPNGAPEIQYSLSDSTAINAPGKSTIEVQQSLNPFRLLSAKSG